MFPDKLAALLLLEDVKHEQLLMLTFSRAAATEFTKRLKNLIGNAANFVEIKTFHPYCFDLIGKVGNLEKVDSVVREAVKMIPILQLRSGCPLMVNREFLKAEIAGEIRTVGKFSKACISQIERLKEKGYVPIRAEVRFIVAWRGEDDLQETAVLLPNIYFDKV